MAVLEPQLKRVFYGKHKLNLFANNLPLPLPPDFHFAGSSCRDSPFQPWAKTEASLLADDQDQQVHGPSEELEFVKITSFTGLLTLSQTSPSFYVSAVQVLWKDCEKRRNCS